MRFGVRCEGGWNVNKCLVEHDKGWWNVKEGGGGWKQKMHGVIRRNGVKADHILCNMEGFGVIRSSLL